MYKIFDRIDIQCEIQPVPFEDISKQQEGEKSAAIRERVIKARKIQEERYRDFPHIHCNAQMTDRMLHEFCQTDEESMEMLKLAMKRYSLSARAYSRIMKVARTIADLAGSDVIRKDHIYEAVSYRSLDRSDWCERM